MQKHRYYCGTQERKQAVSQHALRRNTAETECVSGLTSIGEKRRRFTSDWKKDTLPPSSLAFTVTITEPTVTSEMTMEKT
jgi:hypothetical protein